MNSDVRVVCFTFIVLKITTVSSEFDPFMDSNWFTIDWAGALRQDDVSSPAGKRLDENSVVITTINKEKYRCSFHESMDKNEKNSKKSYSGPTIEDLMENLYAMKSCSYRIEPYWTYELCHGKHLRQYHEIKEPGKKVNVQEYFLGYFKPSAEVPPLETEGETQIPPPTQKQPIDTRKVEDLEMPYYKVEMEDGTPCDLTGDPRRANILYICQPQGRGEIYQFKEISTCDYEVMVLTSSLCNHPDYLPKEPDVSKIQCHALDGSPLKPHNFDQMKQLESSFDKYTFQQDTDSSSTEDKLEKGELTVAKKKGGPPLTGRVHRKSEMYQGTTSIGPSSDKQLLNEFLAGDYCLHGGAGWWRHEFCYGKFVAQYHQDPSGRSTIFLGNWVEKKHLEWLETRPHKRPKPVGKRRWISQLYTNGEVCDLTGNPRTVEVRLKCRHNPSQPHAVSLYLVEPVSCEYELVVESPLFCALIDQADENSIITNPDV